MTIPSPPKPVFTCTASKVIQGPNPEILRKELKKAIEEKKLTVYYQPQVDSRDGACKHFEALVRWNHEELGFISPGVFIPVAEEMGLVGEITHFVIKRVASDIAMWQRSNSRITSVAVNISAKLFSSRTEAERLMGWLDSINPAQSRFITLELTETALVKHKSVACYYLNELSRKGFKLALDDFGTGYSSFAYLLDFPINVVKIDRCFVSALPNSDRCSKITKAIIDLARSLDIEIVAEGVETKEELLALHKLGCWLVQGYFFARPLNMEAANEYAMPGNSGVRRIA